jgi:hypothetical protein
MPANAFIVPDPYETYLKTLPEGQKPKPLVVARVSHALRSIVPIVNNIGRVECVVDPGCQVIAMSEDVCNRMMICYDPTLVVQMVSANGTLDYSLGLARNVPFQFGEITLYLQIHVLRGPAYDVLLGRPFDVLTRSVVRNYQDERQTITICDPNTGKQTTIPTIARGSRSLNKPDNSDDEVEEIGDFHNSMI